MTECFGRSFSGLFNGLSCRKRNRHTASNFRDGFTEYADLSAFYPQSLLQTFNRVISKLFWRLQRTACPRRQLSDFRNRESQYRADMQRKL